MKQTYKILRSILVTLIVVIIAVPAALYIALSLPPVQRWLCETAEGELSKLIATDVDIDYVHISPFSNITLHGISLTDSIGKPIAEIKELGAGININSYLFKNLITVDYAEIIGLKAYISRDSIGAPLNIQPIITALQPKDKTKPPTKFDFQVKTVVLRTSSINYDITSEVPKESGFDPNHIAISDLRADIQLPQLRNNDFIVDLRRLAFNEKSGISLKNISAWAHISEKQLELKNFTIALPNSELKLNDQSISYNSLKELSAIWKDTPFDIHLLPGSHLAIADISPFASKLSDLDMVLDAELHACGTVNDIAIKTLSLSNHSGVNISLSGSIKNLLDTASSEGIYVGIPNLSAQINMPKATATALKFATIKPELRTILTNLAYVDLTASFSGTKQDGNIDAKIKSSKVGTIEATAVYSRPKSAKGIGMTHLSGAVLTQDFSGAELMAGLETALTGLTNLNSLIDFDITTKTRGIPEGSANINIESASFRKLSISDLTTRISNSNGQIEATSFIDNDHLFADIQATANIDSPQKSLNFKAEIENFDINSIKPSAGNDVQSISVNTAGSIIGTNIDDIAGRIDIKSLLMQRTGKPDFTLTDITVASIRNAEVDSITVRSNIADVTIAGQYNLSTIVPVAKSIVSRTIPVLTGDMAKKTVASQDITDPGYSDINYSISVKDLEPLTPLVKLPVKVLDTVKINGAFNSQKGIIDFRLLAPYLQNGKKIIENTSLQAGIISTETPSASANSYMYFTTTLPTKKGMATVITTTDVKNNQADTHVEWKIDRERDFSGDLNISAIFSKNTDKGLCTDIHINPSKAVFNDTVWTVNPALIKIQGKEIDVTGFNAWRDNQSITMSGRASENPSDTITLKLQNISLDYIFETLDISAAMFGGSATGTFYATELLTGKPVAYTECLDVKNMTYNRSLLGDAKLKANWNNHDQSVSLYADILQRDNRHSYVDGKIFVTKEALDLNFKADRLNIGFLKPFMAAFASDVKGYASGNARLFGTFKLVDMTGDIYGEDVGLTIGFTNCSYTTTDSVKLRPGNIDLKELTMRDAYGNTAKLNGKVRHYYFKDPEFDFHITDAKNFLVYDVKENTEHPWFGRIFGNGSASIIGVPGVVDISVNMATAQNSTFTFVLSDALSAQDYKFITFRDRDQAKKDSIAAANALPPAVAKLKKELESGQTSGPPSAYNLNFNIDINQQALITLVMDPVGGDRIKAYGDGNLRMSYDSTNEDLRMNGSYTLERGSYNFTLQEIIIKDFKINSGSKITFLNDPYAAQLDLVAKYQVKANLTDLDESFLEDKELNRTNVPVDALLIVKGDMRQPEISFDLDLPTLTPDTKRKVKSIISTDDMMSRQVLYLLALNRFYTPEYMNNSSHGNELMSVASGTISSQLSNILGQISDNWAIAPNFRSDRGDFSDMEFDVALSSSLLNNRLILNGNLGYRDKTLNNNSFVGDFDIEYLLNSSGTLRLKAYNRYNDQNYYYKSAQTTQGVGIMFKHNFDEMFSFLKPLFKRKKEKTDSTATDSVSSSIPNESSTQNSDTTQVEQATPQPAKEQIYSDFLQFK